MNRSPTSPPNQPSGEVCTPISVMKNTGYAMPTKLTQPLWTIKQKNKTVHFPNYIWFNPPLKTCYLFELLAESAKKIAGIFLFLAVLIEFGSWWICLFLFWFSSKCFFYRYICAEMFPRQKRMRIKMFDNPKNGWLEQGGPLYLIIGDTNPISRVILTHLFTAIFKGF